MKVFFLLIFLFFYCEVSAQVVCNDLKNPDCQCSWKAAKNILLNPSFEEYDQCPNYPVLLDYNIIKDWPYGVAWNGSANHYHPLTCKDDSAALFYHRPIQLPLPDGKAFVSIGSDNSLVVSRPENTVRKAYIAQCLQTPLIKGNKYTFTFYAGRFKSVVNTNFVPFPIQLGIFGNTNCNAVPFGKRTGTGNGCPSNFPGWVLLGSASVYSNGTWVQAKIEFTAPEDISVLEVGPDCSLIPWGVEDLENKANMHDNLSFYLDNLQLAETKDFNFKYISVQSGTPCTGNYILKTPAQPGAVYQWYRDSIAIVGAVNDIYSVPDSVSKANYNVRLTLNGNCQITEPYTLRRSLVYSLKLPADTFLCKNDTLVLAKARPGIKYSWNGITDNMVKIHAPGTFIITATDTLGCSKNFTTQVNFQECAACTVFVPSAFTPNSDGLNDVLRGNINCPVDEYQLQVFNRWGQKVFDTRNANSGWDGLFKGKQATVGVYVYSIRFKNSVNEKNHKYKKGTFVLLR